MTRSLLPVDGSAPVLSDLWAPYGPRFGEFLARHRRYHMMALTMDVLQKIPGMTEVPGVSA
jgi:hypothetical protein